MANSKEIINSIVLCLVILALYVVMLFVLRGSGYIVFVNRASLFQQAFVDLGSSVYFFGANFLLFIICCLKLFYEIKLEEPSYSAVQFWDERVDSTLVLFSAIGVIYTAVGLMRAFQLGLGNIDQEMAMAIGPWGLLQKLVSGGLIMALLTTIVGGTLHNVFKLIKEFTIGKQLRYFNDNYETSKEQKRLTINKSILKKQEEIISILKCINNKINGIN